ncbi:MAG: 4-hydroxybenzoate 3-monooxygenase [Pseudomonadota bacterium]
MRTAIGIVGSGPAGLLLSQLLARQGIDTIVIDRQPREYIEGRIRAGVLEWSTVDVLSDAGVGDRMMAEGLPHGGFDLAFQGAHHRIDLEGLTGKRVMVYGQTEITKDLFEKRATDGQVFHLGVSDTRLEEIASDKPRIHFQKDGEAYEIECDFIAGCDGFHGVSRQAFPSHKMALFERVYPFGWLGLLTARRPVAEELIYTNHERGFSLCSMRSKTLSRYYLQVPVNETVDAWSDERFWEELKIRLGEETSGNLETGPSIEKSIAPLRSFVAEPMQYGRLFLAGDAAHIVPPTGAKGLNLAVADVRLLSDALIARYREGTATLLESYSERCLARIWKVERFSWYLTTMMHQFPDNNAFEQRMQRAEFEYVAQSECASMAIAENYVGLPLERG